MISAVFSSFTKGNGKKQHKEKEKEKEKKKVKKEKKENPTKVVIKVSAAKSLKELLG